jgi:hypothetical protein
VIFLDRPFSRGVFRPGALETPAVTNTIWKPIEQAPRGTGPLLLREGCLQPAFVGARDNNGRWYVGSLEVHPAYFCTIPAFDVDDGERPGLGNNVHLNTSLN